MHPDWKSFLHEQGAKFASDTPSAADAAPQPEHIRFTGSAESNAGAHLIPLCHLGLLQSRGEDSATFLHNLLSNDVKGLAAGTVQWTSFNTPKGRMLANPLLWHADDAHWLLMAADLLAGIHKKLSMYLLRSKVKLNSADDAFALLGVSGAQAGQCLQAAGLPVPAEPMQHIAQQGVQVLRVTAEQFIVIAPLAQAPDLFTTLRNAGAAPAGTDTWTLAMIRAGLPLVTAATQEAFVAQMLNYEVIGGINFKKGCYPGQEIVARTQYLGKPKRRMYRLRLQQDTMPLPGSNVFSPPEFGDQAAGEIVNVAPVLNNTYEALAVVRTSAAESGVLHIGSPDGPHAELLDLPYALP